MKTFSEFMCETFLLEMPHIAVDNNITVDLELEVHNKMKKEDFLAYIQHWLNGDNIKSKTPGLEMHVDKNRISNFANQLSKNYFFKLFIVKHYDEDTWDKMLQLLKTKI